MPRNACRLEGAPPSRQGNGSVVPEHVPSWQGSVPIRLDAPASITGGHSLPVLPSRRQAAAAGSPGSLALPAGQAA